MLDSTPLCGLRRRYTKNTKIRSTPHHHCCAAWCFQACMVERAEKGSTTISRAQQKTGCEIHIPFVISLVRADNAWRKCLAGSIELPTFTEPPPAEAPL